MEGRRREEEAYRTMVEDEKKKDSELNAYHELANQLANAVLVLNGYHTHKGDPGVGHDRVALTLSVTKSGETIVRLVLLQ